MDIKLSYIDQGEGFPLILLHGNGESKEYFENQIDYFANTRRVIAIDTRGHGESERGDGELTLKRAAADLYAFMRELNIDKADILGFSDGANIAILFALKHQTMINKLILNGGNIFLSGIKKEVASDIRRSYRYAKKEKDARAIELLSLMLFEPNLSYDALESITVPTLVIAGSDDVIKQSHTEGIARHIPNSKLAIIEGDHTIAYSSSKAFNREVEEFLDPGSRQS